jgi:hypothetical protein
MDIATLSFLGLSVLLIAVFAGIAISIARPEDYDSEKNPSYKKEEDAEDLPEYKF